MLTIQEAESARYHLGYPNVMMAPSLQFGMARPIQTMFLVEDMLKAASILRPETEERVRSILRIMDNIEKLLVEAQERLAVESLDEIKLRLNEPDLLDNEYRRWGRRLAENCGVPIYPYSERYKGTGAGFAGNIPVVR